MSEQARRTDVLILANLDDIIEQGQRNGCLPTKKFAHQQLRSRLKKAGNERRQEDIGAALCRLSTTGRITRHRKANGDIYRSGSRGLQNLSPEMRRSIRKEYDSIQEHRSVLQSQTPLRSVSRTQEPERERSFKREVTTASELTSICSPLAGKHRSRPLHLSVPFSSNIQPEQETDPIAADETLESSPLSPIPIPDTFTAFYRSRLRNSVSLGRTGAGPDTEFSVNQTPVCTIEEIRDLFADAQYFQDKWIASEEENRRLRTERDVQESLTALSKRSSLEKAMDARIRSQELEIMGYREREKLQLRMQTHFEEDKSADQVLGTICQIHGTMLERLRTAFLDFGFMTNIHEELANIRSDDLQRLKNFLGTPTEHSLSDTADDASLVMESLAAAAICIWIFQEPMHCYAMVHTPLLIAYREVLDVVGGTRMLQTTDLTAHARVLESDSFQHVYLEPRVKFLTQRFINALQAIIDNELSFEQRSTFEPVLASIFESAMAIRTTALAARGSFMFTWPKTGAWFDEVTMRDRDLETIANRNPQFGRSVRKVRRVVAPGLQFKQRDGGLVDYLGFALDGEDDVAGFQVVAPTVVLSQ